MDETVEKIQLYKKRDELGRKIVQIIDEQKLTNDAQIELLEEHKEFVQTEEKLRSLYQ